MLQGYVKLVRKTAAVLRSESNKWKHRIDTWQQLSKKNNYKKVMFKTIQKGHATTPGKCR